jgi:nucleoside-diphosphate-sugar epimerase
VVGVSFINNSPQSFAYTYETSQSVQHEAPFFTHHANSMKLILAGATGFLGTEVLHQALADARITSVVALGRRPTSIPALLPSGANADKLDSVVVPDFAGELSNDVLRHFADADACVWYVHLHSCFRTTC